jgi:hypothetical protein
LGHGPNLDHPSLSPMTRSLGEELLAANFEINSKPVGAGANLRELHIFLFRSLEQAFGRVPPQRDKAIRAQKVIL